MFLIVANITGCRQEMLRLSLFLIISITMHYMYVHKYLPADCPQHGAPEVKPLGLDARTLDDT